ncbi:MAE_28990/MAE_18760 family HEPN-like nuclease [Pseudomonas jessenii]|uniref:MAE_28990/MAE_18760 family HEPN-like nuclease n=1 Tax=Pseudomonas jessenii TaxID=77298 RepID=UPI0032E49A76
MRQTLNEFYSSLNRIRALANHILQNTGQALANASVRELHETQQCGSIVLLTGYFEAFLKDLVKAYMRDLCATGVAFLSLPQSIQNKHYEGGGKILTKASEAGRKGLTTSFGSATREDIVSRLNSSSLSPNAGFQIVWEAFADTGANPRADVVKTIGKDLGLVDFWRAISNNSGSQATWSDTAITTKLDDLISKRNSCAHTGIVTPIPTASDILDFADMLTAVGEGFVKSLEAQLSNYP